MLILFSFQYVNYGFQHEQHEQLQHHAECDLHLPHAEQLHPVREPQHPQHHLHLPHVQRHVSLQRLNVCLQRLHECQLPRHEFINSITQTQSKTTSSRFWILLPSAPTIVSEVILSVWRNSRATHHITSHRIFSIGGQARGSPIPVRLRTVPYIGLRGSNCKPQHQEIKILTRLKYHI